MTRLGYDGVVAALPVTIPYERYSTHAAHWFIEHGYSEAPVDALPADKRATYNWQRRSKILFKAL